MTATINISASAPLDIEMIFERKSLRIAHHAGQSSRLVLCFSGIGGKIREWPEIEFGRSATSGGRDRVLYFMDKSRCWLNNPQMLAMIKRRIRLAIAQYNPSSIVALGNSMGGYMAMIMPAFFPIERVLAFGPQYSVNPEHVPEQSRWMRFISRIEQFTMAPLPEYLRAQTIYYIVHGDARIDKMHWMRFPVGANIRHFIMKNDAHLSPQRLKEAGLLEDVIGAAFAGDTGQVKEIMQQADAHPRKNSWNVKDTYPPQKNAAE